MRRWVARIEEIYSASNRNTKVYNSEQGLILLESKCCIALIQMVNKHISLFMYFGLQYLEIVLLLNFIEKL